MSIPGSEHYSSQVYSYPGPVNAIVDLIPADPERVILQVNAPVAGSTVTIRAAVGAQSPVVIDVAGRSLYTLYWSRDGALVQAAWSVQATGTGATAVVVTTSYEGGADDGRTATDDAQ